VARSGGRDPRSEQGRWRFSPCQACGGRRPPPLCALTCAPPVVDRELGVAGLDVRQREDQGRDRAPEDNHDLCPALGRGRDGAPCDVVGWEAAWCRGSGQALAPAATDRGGGGCRSAGEAHRARPATAKFLSTCELQDLRHAATCCSPLPLHLCHRCAALLRRRALPFPLRRTGSGRRLPASREATLPLRRGGARPLESRPLLGVTCATLGFF
jgi:hypothetical protein